ncbi:MAG TPA: sigma-70 family RNA polymerase sigma factor [Bauldia sp.]|nr:sigma-70 family RNA polymerase sigma factor [Bauldia sp.]
MSFVLAPATMRPMMVPPAAAGAHGGVTTGGPSSLSSAAGDETTDEALALRVANGDQRALGEIVRRHGGRLRALAHRFTGGIEADDIVQETFLSFWKTAKRWQPGGPPLAAYLTRIAVNRAIDSERRRRVRRFFGLEDAAEIADPDSTADHRLVERHQLAAVTRYIQELPARQRLAILLSAEGERSNADIADAMGLSVGAVEQLLVRARRTLRMRLANEGGQEESQD